MFIASSILATIDTRQGHDLSQPISGMPPQKCMSYLGTTYLTLVYWGKKFELERQDFSRKIYKEGEDIETSFASRDRVYATIFL